MSVVRAFPNGSIVARSRHNLDSIVFIYSKQQQNPTVLPITSVSKCRYWKFTCILFVIVSDLQWNLLHYWAHLNSVECWCLTENKTESSTLSTIIEINCSYSCSAHCLAVNGRYSCSSCPTNCSYSCFASSPLQCEVAVIWLSLVVVRRAARFDGHVSNSETNDR